MFSPRLPVSPSPLLPFVFSLGEVQEWLNWQHWKCCERETVPWVRIPPSPPVHFRGGFPLGLAVHQPCSVEEDSRVIVLEPVGH